MDIKRRSDAKLCYAMLCPSLCLTCSICPPLTLSQSLRSYQHSYSNAPYPAVLTFLPPFLSINSIELIEDYQLFLNISCFIIYPNSNYNLYHAILSRILHTILFILPQSTHAVLFNLKSCNLLHALLEDCAPAPSPITKVCPYGEGYSKTSPTGCAICPAGMFKNIHSPLFLLQLHMQIQLINLFTYLYIHQYSD
jgi:hypothetical protein